MDSSTLVATLNGTLPLTSSLNFGIIVYLLVGILFFIFIVHTLLLIYHWRKYAERNTFSKSVWILYLTVSTILLSIMLLSALALR